jgi:hypothetical protein
MAVTWLLRDTEASSGGFQIQFLNCQKPVLLSRVNFDGRHGLRRALLIASLNAFSLDAEAANISRRIFCQRTH